MIEKSVTYYIFTLHEDVVNISHSRNTVNVLAVHTNHNITNSIIPENSVTSYLHFQRTWQIIIAHSTNAANVLSSVQSYTTGIARGSLGLYAPMRSGQNFYNRFNCVTGTNMYMKSYV